MAGLWWILIWSWTMEDLQTCETKRGHQDRPISLYEDLEDQVQVWTLPCTCSWISQCNSRLESNLPHQRQRLRDWQTYRQKQRQTGRDRDRHWDRHWDRRAEREKERQTEKDRQRERKTPADTQSARKTDMQRNRQTGGGAETQTDRERNRQTGVVSFSLPTVTVWPNLVACLTFDLCTLPYRKRGIWLTHGGWDGPQIWEEEAVRWSYRQETFLPQCSHWNQTTNTHY